jgi:hypothetical protein
LKGVKHMVLLRSENRSTGHITLDQFVGIVAERLD